MKRALVALCLFGCAAGDDAVKAEPANDAQVDVPLVEVSNEETSSDTGASAETSTDTSTDTFVDTGTDTAVAADTGGSADADTAAPPDTAVADTAPDALGPWSHAIAIDGTNDFYADHEKFPTTTAGYDAYVTWDATSLYFGMSGADIGATPSATKWVFLYVDVDPGSSTGALNGEKYNTQQAKFPAGFGAEFYLRWKTDDSFVTIQKWDFPTSAWTTLTTTVEHKKTASFVEFKLPRASLGSPAAPGLVSFMINEQASLESTYAGLYTGNFTDGYGALKTFTKYLSAASSSASPNAASRTKP